MASLDIGAPRWGTRHAACCVLEQGEHRMTLAEVSTRLNEVSDRYHVPERLRLAGDTARKGANVAYDSARKGANAAYHLALEHPRASMAAGAVLAVAVIGGVLWTIFGHSRLERRQPRQRVRAGSGKRRAKS
jgi:hypothetical protein